MRQYLWLLNSFLLIIFILTFSTSWLIRKEIPTVIKRKEQATRLKETSEQSILKNQIELIYKKDLFGTYQEPASPKELEVPQIPEFKTPETKTPPEEKKPEIIEPLNIKLKGILYTQLQDQSTAFIADETNKESKYYTGDKIKDSQIIKISKDRIIILRNNGQQETIYLRKEDNLMNLESKDQWTGIIKKIDDLTFEIDPIRFQKKIGSLGEFIETLELATTYKNGEPIGLEIGQLDNDNIGTQLGLKTNDIITLINNNKPITPKDRFNIFENLKKLNINDSLKISLNRDDKQIELSYQLANIEISSNNFFSQAQIEGKPEGEFTLSRDQQKQKQQQSFKKSHPQDKTQLMESMRQKWLENMRNREKNMRNR